MFRIDSQSKRSKIALRYFTYGVMTVSTIAISFVSILLALGYRFDQQHLTFQQGGLIQLISTPPNANVAINGSKQPVLTPTKSSLAPGNYTVSMTKTGYADWIKNVPLKAGQLLWLNYARLIPNSIKTTSSHEFPSLVGMQKSPDHNWLALQTSSDKPDFIVTNVQDPTKPKNTSIEINENKLTKVEGATRSFQLVEWDLSSRYFLVRYAAGTTVEYLRVDRTGSDPTINITQSFQMPISDIHFTADNPNVLYALNGTVLRRIDLSANNASGALVDGVKSFSMYGPGVVSYVASHERTPGDVTTTYVVAGMYDRAKDVPVKEYPAGTSLLVDYSEYFGHSYIAITNTAEKSVDIIRDPTNIRDKTNKTFTTANLSVPAQWLNFSDNGRMLIAQTGNTATTYDLETDHHYQFTINTQTPVKTAFQWIDNYYLSTDTSGTLKIFEFDGQNQHDITGVQTGYGAMLSGDEKYFITIGMNKSSAKYQLQLSKIQL